MQYLCNHSHSCPEKTPRPAVGTSPLYDMKGKLKRLILVNAYIVAHANAHTNVNSYANTYAGANGDGGFALPYSI